MPARACDRCYAMKERCVDAAGSSQCERCLRLRQDCARTRRALRPGRKPRSTPDAPPLGSTLQKWSPPDASSSRHAADPLFDDDVVSCQQFRTLAAAFVQPLMPGLDLQAIPPQMPASVPQLKPAEKALLARMMDKSNFAQHMVLGPSFADALQRVLCISLACSFDHVKDIFLACYGSLAIVQGLELEGAGAQENRRRSLLAVRKLHARGGHMSEDLPAAIVLAIAIITFELCAVGSSAPHVRRLVLRQVMSRDCVLQRCESPSELICLTTFDIHECLFRRQIPLVRPPSPHAGFVDSYIGLCHSLTPYMYDACCLSNALQQASEEDSAAIFQALLDLDKAVQKWQPHFPPHFTSRYQAVEVTHMLAQVRVYRTAVSLFIHRLTHPFDPGDSEAERMAQSILAELELARAATQMSPRCVTMPLMLASIEARGDDHRKHVLQLIDLFVGHTFPLLRTQIKRFLAALWDTRDYSTGVFWLELVPSLPPVTVAI